MDRRARTALVLLLMVAPLAGAAEPKWSLVRPSNTGVPGELVEVVRQAPDGTLWVAARWPFWGEGGIGVFDPATGIWKVWSNWETPIPSEYINDIEFGPGGEAWIATDRGLVRYQDGAWTVYDPSNTPMRLYIVRDISVAPDGHVWVNNSDFGAAGDAIYDFDGDATWTRYAVPDQLPWDAPWTDLSHVFVHSSGNVWVGNDTLSGVAEFDGTTWTLRGRGLGRLDEMAEDQLGNLWINGEDAGGVFRWDGAGFTPFGIGSTITLASDPTDGSVYFSGWNGEIRRTPDGGATIETFLTGLNPAYNVAPAGKDVWVGTIGAVGHFLADGVWIRDYNSYNSGLPDYFVDRMTTDRDGYLWVATGEAGLSRFDGARWRNWGEHNAGSEPYPFTNNEPMGTAYQDRDGVHWFGGNGIARWDPATGQFDGFWNWQNNPGMGVGLWIDFAEDAAGNLFAVERDGATYRFNRAAESWDLEPIDPDAPFGVAGMQADGQGNVWLAAWFDIFKWDGAEWTLVDLPYADYLFDLGGIASMAIGPDDVIWLGTNEGLVRWDGVEFRLYDMLGSPLPHPQVTGLDVRDDGLIGLSAVDFWALDGAAVTIRGDIDSPESWTVFPYGGSPLPHWQLEAVEFDPNGDLWVSALSEGVAVLLVGPSGGIQLAGPEPGEACVENTWTVTGATPGGRVHLAYGLERGDTPLPGCPGAALRIRTGAAQVLGSAVADAEGTARLRLTIPCGAAGRRPLFQAVELGACATSPAVEIELR